MFLHLIYADEKNKFIKSIERLYDSVEPNNNYYACYHRVRGKKNNVLLGNYPLVTAPRDVERILQERNDWEGVIFSPCYYEYMKVIPKNIPICGISWGEWGHFDSCVYYPKTPKAVRRLSFKQWIRNAIFTNSLIYNLYFKYCKIPYRFKPIADRLAVFSSFVEDEYCRFREYGLFTNCEFIWGTVGAAATQQDREIVFGNNIILGHNASPTNNHLDLFEKINQFDISNRKIFVPLSYAIVSQKYREKVIQQGRKLFGEQFVPLMEFMPFEQYMDIFDSCSIFVCGDFGNCALGNIILALRLGKKVYMPKNSLLYNNYKKHTPLNLLSIEDDLTPQNPEALNNYSDALAQECHNHIIQYVGFEKHTESVRRIFSCLRSLKNKYK